MVFLNVTVLQKLQRVQNTAGHLLTNTRKSAQYYTCPVLIVLHWLPVQYRIQFKIIFLAYKAVNYLAPSYLKELLHCHTSQRMHGEKLWTLGGGA
jgi:hypothetical protein